MPLGPLLFRAALHRQADLGTIVHTGRNGNYFFECFSFKTASTAGMAGSTDHLARSVTVRAGGHLHHRAQEGLAHLPHLAPAAACAQRCALVPGSAPLPSAGTAGFIPGDLNLFFYPENRFFKGQFDGLG